MDNKEKIIGEFKPKREFLNFVSSVKNLKVRLLQKTAFIKGERLSGIFDGLTFKITICDEGTINFEEVGTDVSNKEQLKRLIDNIDSTDVTGYAEKFIVHGLDFYDENDNLCYLEVEHKKPIDVLKSIFEKPEISKRGLSVLDSLFGDDEDDDLDKIDEDNLEKFELETEDIKSKDNSISKSYMEEQFKKMNEDKINELKKRIEEAESEIKKLKREITINETKLEKQEKDLSVLETRLDSFNVSDEPNGYLFYVSEEQKPEDIGLTQENRMIADKIADIIGIDKEKLFNVLTEGYYVINIAEKSNITEEIKVTRDVLQKIESLTNYDTKSKITMISPGKFQYSGSLDWHQIVNKMIHKGFEQDKDFDNMFNKEINKNDKEMSIKKFNEMGNDMTELKTKVLKSFSTPTDFVILGSKVGNGDFSITDDFETLHIYVNGKNVSHIETDGFVTILSMDEFEKFKNDYADISLELFECVAVSNYKGDINVGIKCTEYDDQDLMSVKFINDFDFNDYLAWQINADEDNLDYEVFINLPSGTKFTCQSVSSTTKEDLEKENDELRWNLIYKNMSKNEISNLIDNALDRGDLETVKKLSKYI